MAPTVPDSRLRLSIKRHPELTPWRHVKLTPGLMVVLQSAGRRARSEALPTELA